MNPHIVRLQQKIEPLRQEITGHKVYSLIKSADDLKVFMEYHVYAVWDFMSLLKILQHNLTCTSVPWFPKGSGEIRYLINEIVAGEESDIDDKGIRKSHFELYLDAMQQCGADTTKITQFLSALQERPDFEQAYLASGTPPAAKSFVDFTFDIIGSGKQHLQAAIFTFGREDLIPGMFIALVNDINRQFPDSVSVFKYYLDRHIEVDGDHHSQLALEMTSRLCGNDDRLWAEAEASSVMALQKRIELWDGIYEEILTRRKMPVDAA